MGGACFIGAFFCFVAFLVIRERKYATGNSISKKDNEMLKSGEYNLELQRQYEARFSEGAFAAFKHFGGYDVDAMIWYHNVVETHTIPKKEDYSNSSLSKIFIQDIYVQYMMAEHGYKLFSSATNGYHFNQGSHYSRYLDMKFKENGRCSYLKKESEYIIYLWEDFQDAKLSKRYIFHDSWVFFMQTDMDSKFATIRTYHPNKLIQNAEPYKIEEYKDVLYIEALENRYKHFGYYRETPDTDYINYYAEHIIEETNVKEPKIDRKYYLQHMIEKYEVYSKENMPVSGSIIEKQKELTMAFNKLSFCHNGEESYMSKDMRTRDGIAIGFPLVWFEFEETGVISEIERADWDSVRRYLSSDDMEKKFQQLESLLNAIIISIYMLNVYGEDYINYNLYYNNLFYFKAGYFLGIKDIDPSIYEKEKVLNAYNTAIKYTKGMSNDLIRNLKIAIYGHPKYYVQASDNLYRVLDCLYDGKLYTEAERLGLQLEDDVYELACENYELVKKYYQNLYNKRPFNPEEGCVKGKAITEEDLDELLKKEYAK